MVRDILLTKEIDVLVIDLELELSSIFEVKTLLKKFSKTKIIILVVFQNKFMLQMLLKLVFQDSTKKLETLGISIIKVHQGKIIMNETVKKNLALIIKQSKSERLYRNFLTVK
jgi:DNA-binding NarL/FixJ family response regulator